MGHTRYFGSSDYGAYGEHTSGNLGYLGSAAYGTYGANASGAYSILGGLSLGAYGAHNNGNHGWLGSINYGAYGKHAGGNYGFFGSVSYAVYGANASGGYGFFGSGGSGAYGEHADGHYGRLGGNNHGVYGQNTNGNRGFLGHDDHGAYGQHGDGHHGSLGGSFYGVYGRHTNNNRGYLGHEDYGVWATSLGGGLGWAAWFEGHALVTENLFVDGTLIGGSAASKVDHPLDPAGKYLSHSFVESPDMMTVYNGNVTLDAQGEAVVVLPDYFEALNRDFRYQLTAVGAPEPNLYIAEEIRGNRFTIAGGASGMKVSWQVTGIRQDAWANENRIVVEEDKPVEERGFYLHPSLYGQPKTRRVRQASGETPPSIDPEGEQRAMDAERRQNEQERRRVQAERERVQNEQQPQPPLPHQQP